MAGRVVSPVDPCLLLMYIGFPPSLSIFLNLSVEQVLWYLFVTIN
jgi:hypothetical protein